MPSNEFFDEQSSATRVKTDIVVDYFKKWSSIMMNYLTKPEQLMRNPNPRIAYLDLFSGLGIFDDNKKSTPILILEYAIQDERLPSTLVTIFNDKEKSYIEKLKTTAENLPNYNSLKYEPIFQNEEIDESVAEQLEYMDFVPSLLFIDPFGYKGLSLKLIRAITKNWGCDCIFFFNCFAVIRNLFEEKSTRHLLNLFGTETVLEELRRNIESCKATNEKENIILDTLEKSLQEMGAGKYTLKFCLPSENTPNVNRYLVFVTKHVLGYEKMKKTMSDRSAMSEKGVPLYGFEKPTSLVQTSLFEFEDELFNKLKCDLISIFGGKTISVLELYKRYHVGKPYVLNNIKLALAELEQEGKVSVVPKARRHKGKFAENTEVIFP